MEHMLGIDIGGTGIKAAPVDVSTGMLLTARIKLPTPRPALPSAVAEVVKNVVTQLGWTGPAGSTFPGVVVQGVVRTAPNLDQSWVSVSARDVLSTAIGQPVTVLNDADAAGIAEMTFGAGKGVSGTVLMVTIGTGIGSALFYNGVLVPNTEFGHIEQKGVDAEQRASERVREEESLSWHKWASRVDAFLDKMEQLLSPELIIMGGGISKRSGKFLPMLSLRAKVVPAVLLNDAGIVGAAMAATNA